jgi:hypothetical protein
MRYSGSIDNVVWRVGTAWATNPYGPYHRSAGPDIDLGPSGSWDDVKVLRGAIHYHNGLWYSLYTGNGETSGWPGYQGGIATADARAVEDALTFETRTSPDAASWEEWRAVVNGGPMQSTADRYLQYRTTFNVSAEDLTPILRSVHISYEGIPLATTLSLFVVNIESDAVAITWSVLETNSSDEFRLVGSRDGEEWIVPYKRGSSGVYTARDRFVMHARNELVTYDLYYRTDTGDWQLLRSEEVDVSHAPFAVRLVGASPNPFNGTTDIGFTLNAHQKVRLTIYNAAGQRVATLTDREFGAGYHTVPWNGRNDSENVVSSGIYFVQMETKKFRASKHVVLIR